MLLDFLMRINKKYAVKLLWQKRGHVYHLENMSMSYRLLYNYLSELCLNENPSTILEYGCGYGFLLKNIYEINMQSAHRDIVYNGIDYSSSQIGRAREYFSNGNFTVADLTQFNPSIKESIYDVVMGVGVLMYIQNEDIQRAINELYRICNKKIFVVEYYYKYMTSEKQLAFKKASSGDGRCIYDYAALMDQAGFKKIEVIQLECFQDRKINTLNEMAHTLVIGEK